MVTNKLVKWEIHIQIPFFRSPAAGLKQRQAAEETEMEVEPETIEVVDAKGRKQIIEAPIMVPATGEMIEDGGDIEL